MSEGRNIDCFGGKRRMMMISEILLLLCRQKFGNYRMHDPTFTASDFGVYGSSLVLMLTMY